MSGISQVVSKGRNGVGSFVLQCKRIDLHYCDHWASSREMIKMLRNDLATFARQNPQIEFHISPRPNKHPVMIGHYINGGSKPICVRQMDSATILEKLDFVKSASGEKIRRVTKPVGSENPSVRGVWDPFHGAKIHIA